MTFTYCNSISVKARTDLLNKTVKVISVKKLVVALVVWIAHIKALVLMLFDGKLLIN